MIYKKFNKIYYYKTMLGMIIERNDKTTKKLVNTK